MKALCSKEVLRENYKPEKVQVLFVGESVPANGTFFYEENSNLYRYTREAFESVGLYSGGLDNDFLSVFRQLGCYLVDLCNVPVNAKGTHIEEKQAKRREGVSRLTREIDTLDPSAIIAVKLGIDKHVKSALRATSRGSGWFRALPFPAHSHHQRFVDGLSNALRELMQRRTIPAPKEFAALTTQARRAAKQAGLKPADVAKVAAKVRRSQ